MFQIVKDRIEFQFTYTHINFNTIYNKKCEGALDSHLNMVGCKCLFLTLYRFGYVDRIRSGYVLDAKAILEIFHNSRIGIVYVLTYPHIKIWYKLMIYSPAGRNLEWNNFIFIKDQFYRSRWLTRKKSVTRISHRL